jgi:hypothetical protein
MNDFDFEELDKAVNKLATKTQDEHGALDPGVVPSVAPASARSIPIERSTTPEVKPDATVRSQSKPTEPTASPLQLEPQPQKRSARLNDTRPRNRGAFMDIMPPASRRSGSRAGVSLQPINKPEDIVPEPEGNESEIPISVTQDVPTPEVPRVEATVAVEKKPDDVNWPDPLDFGSDKKDLIEKTDEQPVQPEAPTTPFLTEAKVEKRPLGAFSNFKPAVSEAKPIEQTPTPEAPKPQDELTPEKDGTFKEPEPAKPKVEEKPDSLDPEAPKPAEASEEAPKPDLHSAAMMSIPQQYRTEAKSTDKATRPIFDTKEYHPPLLEATSHEHRGGGVWGKIFIAFVTLVLLAVAGYFAYLYIAQQ